DALWGYRTPEFDALGRAAARLDDALNLVPSRVTALGIVAAARLQHEDAANAAKRWWHEGGRTVSPNAGQPMAAMAGALGVRLEKQGTYVLGEGLREPEGSDIGRAVRLARRAAMLVGAGLFGAMLVAGEGA